MAEDIRVALCDDHGVVRAGLRRILEVEPDLEVVGEAATGEEAVRVATETRPDVLVMDIGLPDMTGIAATRKVTIVSPDTRVLVLTVHDDLGYLRQAFEAGAVGYLVKDAADIELVLAVRTLARGRRYVHPTLGAALLAANEPGAASGGPGGTLSGREREVLRLVTLGHTNAEIASALFLSVRTVETHRAHIHQKLGRQTRAELVAFAREAGLLNEPPDSP